jgi:preprotein translocase subunit SecA
MKFVFDWPILSEYDLLGKEMFSETYHFNADPRIPEMLEEYLTNYTIPERIQNEIDEFEAKKNEERSRYFQSQSSSQPIINTEPKIGRNDPCPCGSGNKYKKCCMNN